jgi:uncharacterized protein (DUF302 family)
MERKTHNQHFTPSGMNFQKQEKMGWLIQFISGLIVGVVLVGTIGWWSMPGMMLAVHQSRFDTVEETCTQLKSAIEANGWQSPAIRNMNKAMAEHGVQMDKPVRIVELCNATYARDILMTNPEVSTLMPCAWGVYEGKDGRIYISGMNMGLMGKMFGGNIAKVMGTAVSKDEARMLGPIIRE